MKSATGLVIRKLLPLITLAVLMAPGFAHAQDAIGRVVRASGVVNGVNAAGDERPLARGSNVYVGETITTGGRGEAQIRLTDGAMINLNEDSFFTVDEYEFDGAGGADDTVVMTMVQGTMRTVTGIIGDATGDTYEMNTPFASIGVRGTEYGLVVDTSGRMRIVVFDGSIAVGATAGGGGFTVLGVEGDADAAEINDDAQIIPLTEIPEELQVVVEQVIEVLTDDEVNDLPDDEIAVEVQINQDQQQQQNDQEAAVEQLPINDDGTGVFVDAVGNAINAQTEEEVTNAQTTVIISVSETVPGAFDLSVSPN